MMYKGEGLDVQVLRDKSGRRGRGGGGAASVASSGWPERALNGAGPDEFTLSSGPLLVDDIVMRCCNQAYDLAMVHRAAAVGLEHLIHAMTLVDAASEALAGYHIDVSTLRRESASIIASGMPLGRSGEQFSPRPSKEFDELLQFAAERSYLRRSPVTTEDLLDILLDMKRDLSSRNLLSRHRRDWDLRAEQDPMGTHEPRERVRVSAGSHHMGEGRMNEARAAQPPTHTDSMQNSRIDVLERVVRGLSEDLSLSRQTFASLVEELRHDRNNGEGNQRGQGLYIGNTGSSDSGQSYQEPVNETLELDHDHIIDRLYLLERNVDSKFNELARTWTVLGERLSALEGVLKELPDNSEVGLSSEVAGQLSLLADLPERFGSLEPSIAALPARLGELEQRVLNGAQANSVVPAQVTGKLDKIDGSLDELAVRLEQLENRLDEPAASALDMAPITVGLKDIETRAGDTQLMINTVDDRVQKMENLLEEQRSQLAEVSSMVGTELKAVSSAMSAQDAGGDRLKGVIEEGMRGLSHSMFERLSGVTAVVQNKQAELGQMLGMVSDRIGVLESASSGSADRMLKAAQNAERDSQVMHEALVKINANQQTLATSMDQWRLESKSEIVALTARFGAFEAIGSQEDGWTRFRVWLFGTNDWYEASWGERRKSDADAKKSEAEVQ